MVSGWIENVSLKRSSSTHASKITPRSFRNRNDSSRSVKGMVMSDAAIRAHPDGELFGVDPTAKVVNHADDWYPNGQ
jgi:hypothetical protein